MEDIGQPTALIKSRLKLMQYAFSHYEALALVCYFCGLRFKIWQ